MKLYDNNNINYAEWFVEFKEYCEDNNIDHTQYNEDSDFFINWIYEEISMCWNDLMDEIRFNIDINQPCVVVGTLGLWNGNPDIIPTRFNNLEDAIISCVEKCDYITIEENDGIISIRATHHDGTNKFEIYKLNEQGRELNFDYDEFDIDKHTEKFKGFFE